MASHQNIEEALPVLEDIEKKQGLAIPAMMILCLAVLSLVTGHAVSSSSANAAVSASAIREANLYFHDQTG